MNKKHIRYLKRLLICCLMTVATLISSIADNAFSSGLSAEQMNTDHNDTPHVIKAFEGYDCYGQAAYKGINKAALGDLNETDLPQHVNILLNDGTLIEMEAKWDTSGFSDKDQAHYECELILEDAYTLSDELYEAVQSENARLPWISVDIEAPQPDNTQVMTTLASDTPVMEESDAEMSDTESISEESGSTNISETGKTESSQPESESETEDSETVESELDETISVPALLSNDQRDGATHTVTYYDERYNNGPLRVGYFEIDGGTVAMCVCHELDTPKVGNVLTTTATYTSENQGNELMRKVFFYGWEGPGDIGASYVETCLAASVANGHSDNYYGYGQAFIDRIAALDAAPGGFTVYIISNGASGVQDLGYWEYQPEGYALLKKSSSNPELTEGNACYNLSGAQYGVYTDEGCTNQVETLITGEDGISNTVTLNAGTYFVKEIISAKGYALDKSVHSVVVESGKTSELQVTDVPVNDPAVIEITKIGADSGNTASLAGAQFTIRYYNDFYTKDNLPSEATRTWVIETKEIVNSSGKSVYMALLSDEYKVSGKEFYYESGVPTLPLGTVAIEETKEPSGYSLKGAYLQAAGSEEKIEGVYVAQITQEGDLAKLTGGNVYTMTDQPLRGGVRIQKRDYDTKDTTAQGGATLQGAVFAIMNMNSYPVTVDGQSYNPGQEITTITTNAQGIAQTSSDYLPFGSYKIKEKTPPEGYLSEGILEQSFQISKEDEIIDLTSDGNSIQNKVIRGGIELQKVDADTGKPAAQGTASFKDATFAIKSLNSQVVVIDGKSYSNGQTVMTIKTDKSGIARTSANALPYGQYSVTEIAPSNGYLVDPSEIKFSISLPNQVIQLTQDIKEPVIRGGVRLQKIDAETGENQAQGGASIVAATYAIKSLNDQVVVNGKVYGHGEIVIRIPTDEHGVAATAKNALPYGVYSIYETDASNGYLINDTAVEFSILKNEVIVDLSQKMEEPIIRGGVELRKVDKDTGEADPQGNASLKGAVYIVKNLNAQPVIVQGKSYKTGETVLSLTTDEAGVARTDKDALPFGHYSIQEKTPSDGYQLDKTVIPFDITENHKLVSLSQKMKEPVIRGGMKLHKVDLETGEPAAQGNASLEGAVYAIKNLSDAPVIVNGVSYGRGEEVLRITTDAQGITETSEDVLPFGKYCVYEVEPSEGYMLDGTTVDFEIKNNGEIVSLSVSLPEPIKRGDLELIKVADKTMERLSHVPFKITSKSSGESHIIVTDENGYASTAASWNPHTQNTNRGTSSEDGIWFGSCPPDDQRGALIYDTYIIEEQRCPANKKFDLIPAFEITIRRDNYTVNLGTLTNDYIPREMHTTALDKLTGGHQGFATDEVTIFDHVELIGLTKGNTYELRGVLMDKATGKPLLSDGNEITAVTEFIAEDSDCSIAMEFTLNSETARGKTLVVFEKLFEGGDEILSHEDLDDQKQIVEYPDVNIQTMAVDKESGTHQGFLDETVTIVDTISYNHLIPGESYILKGVLMDQSTGKPYLANGQEVRAEKTFVPDTPDGSTSMDFSFNASGLKNHTLVVFENLYYKDIEIAAHMDINDTDQTVTYPEIQIQTTATDHLTGGHQGFAGNEVRIIDEVAYTGLEPGRLYRLEGILMDKSEGTPYLVDGEAITSETEFVAEAADGVISAEFVFDGSNLSGKELVVFEKLFYQERELAVHEAMDDEGQTVRYPVVEIHTNATDTESGTHQGLLDEEVIIKDEVTYSNLIIGKEYTIVGTLMDKVMGLPFRVNDITVTSEKIFVAEKSNGTILLEYTVDGAALKNKTVVVFEAIYYEGLEIAAHTDINDDAQTVFYPEIYIRTTATDQQTGTHQGFCPEKIHMTDTVKYEGLEIGRSYRLEGTIMDKSTGEPYLIQDQEVKASLEFVPDSSSGAVSLEFTFDGSVSADREFVVFERLYLEDRWIAAHEDIEDAGQTVVYPDVEIQTNATDADSGTHQGFADDHVKIIDVVSYTQLIPGKEYVVQGILMDKNTGEPYQVDGQTVTAETSIIPEKPDGDVSLEFIFSGVGLKNQSVVAFETLYFGEIPIAVHADINDEAQTVDYPEIYIGTSACDQMTETRQGIVRDKVTIIDKVTYKGVEVGRTYKLSGILMDKATGQPYLADDHTVTAEAEFITESAQGYVELKYTLDGSGLKGKELVVFEKLFDGDKQVAAHEDINDKYQTVTYPDMSIHTNAVHKSTNSKEAQANKAMTVVDTVTYSNLIPGLKYTVKGLLMDKQTGEALLINQQEVSAETTFTAIESDGSIKLEFNFDGSSLAGKSLVVFEALYTSDILVASHEDIDDADQTVCVVEVPKKPEFKAPQTGVQAMFPYLIGVGIVLILVSTGVYMFMRKRNKKH